MKTAKKCRGISRWGISKKMNHAPLRLSLTAMYLNRWKFDYIDNADKEYKGDNFAKALFKQPGNRYRLYTQRKLLDWGGIQSED